MFNSLKLNHTEQQHHHQSQHQPFHHNQLHNHHQLQHHHQQQHHAPHLAHMHSSPNHPLHPHQHPFGASFNGGLGAPAPSLLHHPNQLSFDQRLSHAATALTENKFSFNRNGHAFAKKPSQNGRHSGHSFGHKSANDDDATAVDHDDEIENENLSMMSERAGVASPRSCRSRSRSDSESRSRSPSSNRSFGAAQIDESTSSNKHPRIAGLAAYQPSSKRQKVDSPKVSQFQQQQQQHPSLYHASPFLGPTHQQQLFNAYASALAAESQHHKSSLAHLMPPILPPNLGPSSLLASKASIAPPAAPASTRLV